MMDIEPVYFPEFDVIDMTLDEEPSSSSSSSSSSKRKSELCLDDVIEKKVSRCIDEIEIENILFLSYRPGPCAPCGTSIKVLKSAFQKFIRRGDEDRAVRAVRSSLRVALYRSDDPRLILARKKTLSNIRNRLIIIFMEDIFYFDIQILECLYEMINCHFGRKSDKFDSDEFMSSVRSCIRFTILCCRAFKSRLQSWASATSIEESDPLVDELHEPVWFREQSLFAGLRHLANFRSGDQKSKLSVKKRMKAMYKFSCECSGCPSYCARKMKGLTFCRRQRVEVTKYVMMFNSLNMSNDDAWLIPGCMLALGKNRLCSDYFGSDVDSLVDLETSFEKMNDQYELKGYIFPSYVLDKHVVKNKYGTSIFGSDGALISNPFENSLNDVSVDYLSIKMRSDIQSESVRYSTPILTQVPVQKSREVVYLSKVDADYVCVKGPYKTHEEARKIWCRMHEVHFFKGINSVDTRIIPLRFSKTLLPLVGRRDSFEDDEICFFLESTSLFGDISKNLPAGVSVSDLLMEKTPAQTGTPVNVLNPSVLYSYGDRGVFNFIDKLPFDAQKSAFFALLYRYVMGLGDFAQRNFIRIGNEFFNIDFPSAYNESSASFVQKLKAEDKKWFSKFKQENESVWKPVVEEWKDRFDVTYLRKYKSLALERIQKFIEEY